MIPFGIDFGTTNSVVAFYNGSEVEVLSIDSPPAEWANLGFDRVLPSVIGSDASGSPTFGWEAKRQSSGKLEAVKRLFATDDSVTIGETSLAVEQAAALLFRRLRDGASNQGLTMDRAVVTIPANSRGMARFRTKVCAGLAGMEVPALINEPTAAAMAHSIDAAEDHQQILVFDWGGGTLDVTVLETVAGVFIERASKGIQRLGGIDVDAAFADAILASAGQRNVFSPQEKALFRLEVERAKVLLSQHSTTNVQLPDGTYAEATRADFERAAKPLIDQVRAPIDQCMRDLRLAPDRLDHIVMVGGSSKIPLVRDLVANMLGQQPASGVDPMTAIAEGAAIASAILAGQLEREFFVGTEHALGTVVHNKRDVPEFSAIIPRNQLLPAKASEPYTPVSEGQKTVRIRVIEGDPEVPFDHEDNVILKEWDVELDETRPMERSGFHITYHYDVDGILHVTVIDDETGRQMLVDDVSFGVTKDKAGLVRIARWVEEVMTGKARLVGGETAHPLPTTSPTSESEVAALVDKLRTSVVPFLDESEAERLKGLCADLEVASGLASVESAKERLNAELRKYSYLL